MLLLTTLHKHIVEIVSVILFLFQRLADTAEDADLYHEFNASLKVTNCHFFHKILMP